MSIFSTFDLEHVSCAQLVEQATALRQKAFDGTITPAEADRLAAIEAALARIDRVTPGRGRLAAGTWLGCGNGPTLAGAR